jgi:hypothetical protein
MKDLTAKGYRVTDICFLIGISRQGYYKRIAKRFDDIEQYSKLESIVTREREIKSRSGLRAIYHKRNLSTLLGVNRFEQEMSHRGYALKPQKSFIKTTDSRGHQHKFGNLIAGKKAEWSQSGYIRGHHLLSKRSRSVLYIFIHRPIYIRDKRDMGK